SLNTPNGVSSCGGRLVKPIIGRFCGYLTSGRSPLPNGKVTVPSANALVVPSPVPSPAANAASPAPLSRSRLSMLCLPWELLSEPRSSPRTSDHVSHGGRRSQFVLSQRVHAAALQHDVRRIRLQRAR